jgi:hypothetical protein
MVFVFASPAFASFNYGTDTYSTVGNQLIVNSLGDQSTVSTFGSLGTNDWIPENAVKNYLAMEGYTTAIDYNPSITNPQFASAYNQTVPAGYTKITFAGKLGDPRATQDVYVKTEEYNRLNPEMQAERIEQNSIDLSDTSDRLGIDINNANDARANGDNVLQSNINNETTNRANADTLLQNNINVNNSSSIIRDNNLHLDITNETANRVNGDTVLQNNDLLLQDHISNESTNRMNADQAIQGSINNESNDRQNGDNALQSNINNEALNRANADTNLQNNIDINDMYSQQRDTTLQTNIDNEAVTRATGDNRLQNNINTVDQNSQDRDSQEVIDRTNGDQRIQDNVDAESNTRASADQTLQNNINNANNRIDATDKRVSKLEDTQYNVVGKVRVFDSRKIQVNTFVSYSTTRSTVESAGVEVTWKMGKSFEERKNDELEARLNKLERIQTAQQREANSQVYTTKTGMGIRGSF